MSQELKLPLLAPHDDALQKCTYCPKLSRAACPVSNTTHNETHTPWGKMSTAYFMARGDLPIEQDSANTAWACSGCYACREQCDHRNEVAEVLADTRAEMYAADAAPEAIKELRPRLDAMAMEYRDGVAKIDPRRQHDAPVAVVLGCSYVRQLPEEAEQVARLIGELVGQPTRLLRGCCGMPWMHAGDRSGMMRKAHDLHDEARNAERVIAADPGCARMLMVDSPKMAVAPNNVQPLVDLIYAAMDQVPSLAHQGKRVRYHDACQLGRGLGRYEEPRAILARLTGSAPLELQRNREHGECSGAGGLLPVTMPETSRAMADTRIGEHRDAGGGMLVSACPSSVRRFRSRGERARDLGSLVATAVLRDGADD